MNLNKNILNYMDNVTHTICIDPMGIYAVPPPGRSDLKWHLEEGKIVLDSPKEEFIRAYEDAFANNYDNSPDDEDHSQKRRYRTSAKAGYTAEGLKNLSIPSKESYLTALTFTNDLSSNRLSVSISVSDGSGSGDNESNLMGVSR